MKTCFFVSLSFYNSISHHAHMWYCTHTRTGCTHTWHTGLNIWPSLLRNWAVALLVWTSVQSVTSSTVHLSFYLPATWYMYMYMYMLVSQFICLLAVSQKQSTSSLTCECVCVTNYFLFCVNRRRSRPCVNSEPPPPHSVLPCSLSNIYEYTVPRLFSIEANLGRLNLFSAVEQRSSANTQPSM